MLSEHFQWKNHSPSENKEMGCVQTGLLFFVLFCKHITDDTPQTLLLNPRLTGLVYIRCATAAALTQVTVTEVCGVWHCLRKDAL